MTLFITEPPLGAPVTLAGAKAHMRVETGDEDGLIGRLVARRDGASRKRDGSRADDPEMAAVPRRTGRGAGRFS